MNIDWLLNRIKSDALPDRKVRVLGIDLGTTNSAVAEALWDPAFPTEAQISCLEVDQKTQTGWLTGPLVPSVVTLHNGERFVGEGAKRLIARGPELGLKERIDYWVETKNEIGTSRRYRRAPEGYQTPAQIGAHVIRFLIEAAGEPKPDAVVVTVPASFQAAQRQETMEAAGLAGLELRDGDLFDEPVAAYVDHLATTLHRGADKRPSPARLLVFDYGGGTCDIAVFQLDDGSADGLLGISPLSVSRFHRLGGGDVDAAIVYGPLLEQIVEQNSLGQGDLGYDDKKNHIEPALRSVAESLKIGLCREIERRRALNTGNVSFADPLERVLPNACDIPLRSGKVLQLRNPTLYGPAFDSILSSFFDRNVHYAQTSEYRREQSIFAPISDALARGKVKPHDIDAVLLAGGSSNIPMCRDQLAEYFRCADIMEPSDPEDRKLAVARGAALQALAKSLTGVTGLVRPITQDDIALKTERGLLRLISRGTPLPFPPDGRKATLDELAVPRSSENEHVTLRVELVAGEEERLLFRNPWYITPPVSEGEPLRLQFSYNANQVLELELFKREAPRAPYFEARLENPLTHVVNPVVKELEAEELERQIDNGTFSGTRRYDKIWELANLLAGLGQRERALELLRALQLAGHHDRGWLLNRMAIIFGDMSDHQSAERLYREAASTDSRIAAPLYNLALMFHGRGNRTDSIKALDEAIAREKKGSYLVLRARLAGEEGDKIGRAEFLAEAFKSFPSPGALSDFELNAYIRGAELRQDSSRLAKAKEERERRNVPQDPSSEGDLPIMKGDE